MEEHFYCIIKGKHGSLYFGKYSIIPQHSFSGIQLTKMNINTSTLFFYEPLQFVKRVSKSFHDSILSIIHESRDEIISLVEEHKSIWGENQIEGCFFLTSEDRIYLGKTNLITEGYASYSSIIVEKKGIYTELRFENPGTTIKLVEKVLKKYQLDDKVYNLIEQKVIKSHRIVTALLQERYDEAD